jgi:hypothetical protein
MGELRSANTSDGAGDRVLMHAARGGHVECAQMLVDELGAATEGDRAINGDGHGPLWVSAFEGHVECVQLFEAGETDAKRRGEAAAAAAARGHASCVAAIIGADPQARNQASRRCHFRVRQCERTALHLQVQSNFFDEFLGVVLMNQIFGGAAMRAAMVENHWRGSHSPACLFVSDLFKVERPAGQS